MIEKQKYMFEQISKEVYKAMLNMNSHTPDVGPEGILVLVICEFSANTYTDYSTVC